jgi:Tol biopolymer transport system component
VQTGSSAARRSALLSPDGGHELQVMTIADDGARNFHVQPSPDGRHVAFDSDRDGERGIYLADRDGSHVQRVSGPGYAAMPAWSPDSRQLAYIRGEPHQRGAWNLWLLSLDSGAERRLTRHRTGRTWGASWFSDGHRLAYAHDDELVLLDVQSGQSRLFASPLRGRAVRSPAVSPDGRYVMFQVDRHGAWLLDVNRGWMQCALADPNVEAFAWTPDARRVAFRSRRTGEWGMWIMAARRHEGT